MLPNDSVACTSFVIKGGGRQYLAKNLDWHCGEGYLIYNPQSVVKYSFNNQGNSFSWVSQYSSITFNQFGVGFPLGGMNSAGLIIEELNAPGSGAVHQHQAILNEFQWVQYMLDNHSNVAGVISSTQTIGVKPLIQNLHYIIMDVQGDVAIIEIIDGEYRTYSGDEVKYSVLSNNLYGNSLKYLAHFTGFGGELPLADSRDSQTRFVTIANQLKQNSDKVPDKELAFLMLSGVSQYDTQWSIVYDNKESKIFFKDAISGEVVQFSFESANIRFNRCYKYLDLSDCRSGEYLTGKLTAELNMHLFHRIEEDYRRADISDIKLSILKELFIFGNEYLQKGRKHFIRKSG
jgi:choloylglycine hydrolase